MNKHYIDVILSKLHQLFENVRYYSYIDNEYVVQDSFLINDRLILIDRLDKEQLYESEIDEIVAGIVEILKND